MQKKNSEILRGVSIKKNTRGGLKKDTARNYKGGKASEKHIKFLWERTLRSESRKTHKTEQEDLEEGKRIRRTRRKRKRKRGEKEKKKKKKKRVSQK